MIEDPITRIEKEIKNSLLLIDTNTPLTTGYEFYNTVSIVNLEDEAVFLDRANSYPLINIYLQPGEKPRRVGTDCTEYTLTYKLDCMVDVEDEFGDTPQFDINRRLNELLFDIKATLFNNRTLNCSADDVNIIDSFRVRTKQGDVRRQSNLVVLLQVRYTTLDNNPIMRRR